MTKHDAADSKRTQGIKLLNVSENVGARSDPRRTIRVVVNSYTSMRGDLSRTNGGRVTRRPVQHSRFPNGIEFGKRFSSELLGKT